MIEWILFGIAATVPFIPLLLRGRVSERAVHRIVMAADGLWDEAGQRGQQSDKRLVDWHDALVMFAGVAPHVACGLVDLNISLRSTGSSQEIVEAMKTTEGLEWAVPFLMTGVSNLGYLEFFGRPYDLLRWPREIYFGVVMRTIDGNGAATLAPARKGQAYAVNRVTVAMQRLKRHGVRRLPAC